MTKGFTLIETLVAITILAIAIVGPFFAVQSALLASYTARDQLIASSLAQEGAEYIRNVRDNNFLANRAWLFGLNVCRPGPCVVDTTQNTVSGSVGPLYLSATNIYTQQQTGTVTKFTRTVSIEDISAFEVRVTVTVTWNNRGVTNSVVVEDRLSDWL